MAFLSFRLLSSVLFVVWGLVILSIFVPWMVSPAKFEADFPSFDTLNKLAAASTEGSATVLVLRFEQIFACLAAVNTLYIGLLTDPERRAIPALTQSLFLALLCFTAHGIVSNGSVWSQLVLPQISKSKLFELMQIVRIGEAVFGFLFLSVSVLTFLGWAKRPASKNTNKKA